MSDAIRRGAAGLGLAALTLMGGACILIERYDAPVPDVPDAGGGGSGTATTTTIGSGGTGSTTTSTTTGSSTSTTSTTSTVTASGGAGGTGTGGSGGTGGTGGTGTVSSTTASSTSSTSSASSSASSSGVTGTAIWSDHYGGMLDDSPSDIAADSAGNWIVTGTFQDKIDFGGGVLASAGQTDGFVVKLDAGGAHQWSKRFGDALPQVAASVGVDGAGRVYVAGSFQGTIDFGAPTAAITSAGLDDLFLAKLDAAGAPIWAKRYGDAGKQTMLGRSIVVTNAGHVILGGALTGTIDLGDGPLTSAGSEDVFLARLDANGVPLWKHSWGDAAEQTARAIAMAPTGRIAVVGGMQGSINFGGGSLTAAGGFDMFVAVFDGGGNSVWSKRFGDAAGNQIARTVAFDPAGNVWVAGTFGGTIDFGGGVSLAAMGTADNGFVLKLDANGNHVDSRAYGDGTPPGQAVRRLAVDVAGDVIVAGDFGGKVDFGSGPLLSPQGLDVFVVKLSPAIAPLWAYRFGDASGQTVSALEVDGARNILLGGTLRGSVNFGTGVLTSAGGADVYLVELAP